MYTAFYGLREKPFALSPDPRFLYLAGSHREALAHLLYGIEQGEGFISVTGEVGTGKTTLCRTLLERLEGEIELAFLFNPSRTALELLQSICAEFGLPAEGLARRSLMAQLNNFLLEKKREGRRVLLIVDEAQTLSENTLEQVRLLSNLETSREKLIQILLLGQPELDRKLDERGLRQLRQRISVRWELNPLEPAETRAYVRHRISVAAGEPKELFSEAALREVHRRTGGVPRLVNQLCDRSLLGGYAERAATIGPGLVRAAAKEIPDARRRFDVSSFGRSSRPWMFLVAMTLLVGLGLAAGLQVGRTRLSDAMQAALFSPDHSEAGGPGQGGDFSVAKSEYGALSDQALAAVGAAPQGLELARPRGPVVPENLGRPGQVVSGDLGDAVAQDADAVTALSKGLLARTLESREPVAALGESERALLERFGRVVVEDAGSSYSVSQLETTLRNRGLEVTAFEGGSLPLIKRLDHPVILALNPDQPGASDSSGADRGSNERVPDRWIAVLGYEGDRVRVAGLMQGREVTVLADELASHWTETGYVVWERYERLPEVLSQGDQGGSVIWLQRSLADLSFYSSPPTGLFDSTTLTALTQFQRDRGLLADGVAGPLTQIALFGRLSRYPVPRLSAPKPQAGSSSRPPLNSISTSESPTSPSVTAQSPDSPSSRPVGLGERG